MLKKRVSIVIGLLSIFLLLATTLAGCGGSKSVSGGNTTSSKTSTIKIGILAPLTGMAPGMGMDMRDGFLLYLKQHNNMMGGIPATVFVEDTASDPGTAVTKAKELVEKDGVNIIFGPLAANCALAVAPYVEGKKVITVLGISSADSLTQRDRSPYIVRTGWASSQPMYALADYAYKTLGYRKIATIGEDYAFGYESVGGFQYGFEKDGGKIVKKIWTPMGTKDYGPYLAQIPKGLDAVFYLEIGSDAANFMKNYVSYGWKTPLLTSGSCTDEALLPNFPEETPAIGTISALHYAPTLQTDANKAFLAAFKKTYGRPADYPAEGGYTGALIIGKVVEALGNQYKDVAKFDAEIQKIKVDAPRGSVTIDSYLNPVENVYIRKLEDVNGQLQNTVVATIPHVGQFWTYGASAVLAHPPFSRTYPPVSGQ